MAVLDKTGLTYFWSKIKAKLDGKANTSHTHDDRYYTEAEINSKLGGFASSSHTHDGRYLKPNPNKESYNGDYYQSPSYTIKPMVVGEFKLVDIKIVDDYGEIRPNETLSIYAPSGGTYLFEGIGKINGGAKISSDTAVVHVNSFIIRLS